MKVRLFGTRLLMGRRLLAGGLCAAMTLCALPAFAGSYEIGLKLYELGDYPLAARYFREAANQHEGNPNIHYYLADSYVKMNRLAEAQAEYQRVLALAPDTQAARLSRVGLSRLRSYLEVPETTRWHKNGESGPGEAIDKYTGGGIGKEDYLNDITENGKIVRWALSKMPLKLYVEKAPHGIRNFQPAFISQIPKALDVWAATLNHQLSYRLVDDPEQADLRLTWTNTIDTRGHDGDGGTSYTAGLTIPNIHDDQIRYMDIKIATFDIKGKPQNTEIIYAVAIHELGHALGLLGHSSDPGDIMYAQNQHVTAPSNRDKNTIRKLYTEVADINNLPASDRDKNPDRDAEIAKKLDETIAKMEKQAKADGMALTYLNLGVAYFQKAKSLSDNPDLDPQKPEENPGYWYQKALNATSQAISLEPKDPHAYHKRSLVYQEMGDFGKALSDIRKAISFDYKEAEYHLLQSWFLAKTGDAAQARSSLDTYLRYKPGEAGSSDVSRIQEEIAKNSGGK
ncbi:MAG TPA: tetratricopeptide repeat protein [Coleofasciculaceae cyanobacterium]